MALLSLRFRGHTRRITCIRAQQRSSSAASNGPQHRRTANAGYKPRTADSVAVARPDSALQSVQAAKFSARRVALEQLLRIEQEGAYAGLAFGSPDVEGSDDNANASPLLTHTRSDASETLSPRDARFVTELVSGVTRWKRKLDFILAEISQSTVASFDPIMLQVLRMGLYELVEMKVPPHACNEHVQLVKDTIRPQAGSFANGVLRAAARLIDTDELPQPTMGVEAASGSAGKRLKAQSRVLGIAHSHPTWMVSRWLKRFGVAETTALLQANNTRPAYGLRINALKIDDVSQLCNDLQNADVDVVTSSYLPHEFLRVRSGLQKVMAGGYVARSECAVQDEAAGMVVALLNPQCGDALLDACAAPGGKTLFSCIRMRHQGRVVACDISAARLRALMSAAERAGVADMIQSVPGAFQQIAPSLPQLTGVAEFDKVLLDAPCSGSGVLSRRADMRWRRTPEHLQQLTHLQDELLEAAAPLVRVGGVLMYSTCSIECEENEDRVWRFLERHNNFRVVTDDCGLPRHVFSSDGFLQLLPHRHGVDGAFAAKLQRLS